MSVDLYPSELSFRRPFNQVTKEILVIKNPNEDAVTFKVKTTAPKQYCVRPNSGLIGPNESVEIQILLQPVKEELPPDFKCRDKFLVQSAKVSADDLDKPLLQLWADTEKQGRDLIFEQKLRCVYIMDDIPTIHLPDDDDERNESMEGPESYKMSDQNLQGQLAEAKKSISKLEAKIAELERENGSLQSQANELRQRKAPLESKLPQGSPSDSKNNNNKPDKVMTKHIVKQTGYSAQLVMLLVVISFMVGVTFF